MTDFENASPTANKMLNEDGSITTLDGLTEISPASAQGAIDFANSQATANKVLLDTGAVVGWGDVISGGGGGGGVTNHNLLTNRNDANQHPISAITGLQSELDVRPSLETVEDLDSAVLAAANLNTENQIAAEAVLRAQGDAAGIAYTDQKILPILSASLYQKSGGIMNQNKPTGTGSYVNAPTLTTNFATLFTFSYTVTEDFTLYSNNQYLFEFWYSNLSTSRTYELRYDYSVGANQVVYTERNGIRTTLSDFAEEFFATNQLTNDIDITAGTVITLTISGRVTSGTGPLRLLVDNKYQTTRIARNEAVTGLSAQNVRTQARGTTESQEAFNQIVYQLANDVPQTRGTSPVSFPAQGEFLFFDYQQYDTFPIVSYSEFTIDLAGIPLGSTTFLMYRENTDQQLPQFINAQGGERIIGEAPIRYEDNKLTSVVVKYDGFATSIYWGIEA